LLDPWIVSVWLKINVKLSLYTSWGRLEEWNYGCNLSWIRYDDRVISKGLWPPRPPDLTPPDYFLWGYLKGRVYQNKPRTIDAMKANITEEIQAVTADVLARTFQNMTLRVHSCLGANGGHFQDMLWCHISHTTNVHLFKFSSNVFICVRLIEEMPGLVASGTPCRIIILNNHVNTVVIDYIVFYV
jgi:hypothetical protein